MLAYLMFKMVLAFNYKHVEKDFDTDKKVSVLVPVYNEKTRKMLLILWEQPLSSTIF